MGRKRVPVISGPFPSHSVPSLHLPFGTVNVVSRNEVTEGSRVKWGERSRRREGRTEPQRPTAALNVVHSSLLPFVPHSRHSSLTPLHFTTFRSGRAAVGWGGNVSNRREERREVGRGTRSVRSVRHSFHSSLTVRTSRVPILRLRLRNVVEGDVRRMERTRVNIPFSFRLITHYALFRHQKIECLLVSFPGSVHLVSSSALFVPLSPRHRLVRTEPSPSGEEGEGRGQDDEVKSRAWTVPSLHSTFLSVPFSALSTSLSVPPIVGPSGRR